MRAIHGAKAKNDRIDSQKIASLLVGRNFPVAYLYPPAMRATRDLLRRRNHLARKRAELLAHIENTRSQYNVAEFEHRPHRKVHRLGLAERFPDPSVRKSVEVDCALIDFYDHLLGELERYILGVAKGHDPQSLALLRTIPGVGKILSLVMLYEIHDIERFPSVGNFLSYSRVVRCKKLSVGKITGTSGKKIGNAHLKWAFSEATCLFLRSNPPAQKYLARLERRHPRGMALSILGQKIARAVYFMLKRRRVFDAELFFKNKISLKSSPSPGTKASFNPPGSPRAAMPQAKHAGDAAGAAPPPAGLEAAPALALRAPPRDCGIEKATRGKPAQSERRRKRTKRQKLPL